VKIRKNQEVNITRIGLHLLIEDKKHMVDEDESPFLIKCKGCEKNISKNKDKEECLIYIENNQESRIIKRRKEEDLIKPYETLRNIRNKNNLVKMNNKEEEKDEEYNFIIDLIDKLISGDEEFIVLIKNSIIEKGILKGQRNDIHLIINTIKRKK
jgi:hypothetical protein